MALNTSSQIFANETLQQDVDVAGFNTGQNVYTSSAMSNDGMALFVLLVRLANAPTGTTPTITFAVQQSSDEVNWSGVGGALASMNAAGVQLTPYAVGTTQGAITQAFWRVTATLTGTGAVFTGVYVDMLSQSI